MTTPNQIKQHSVLLKLESENGHNKPVNIMKQSKKKKVSRQRPHSAITGTSEASTSARHNLNASVNTHAVQMSPTGAKQSWKHIFFPAKPKAMCPEPNQVIWPIKQDKLNKYIYKNMSKLKTCKEKLEL